MSILLDAGPALNFLAVGQQGVLLKAAQAQGLRLTAPERVDREVLGMTNDRLFASTAALATWKKLKANGHVHILSDDLTTVDFTEAVTRISGMPVEQRIRSAKSLGEIMVLAHASVFVQSGIDVVVLIDEQDGRQRARLEQARLARTEAPGTLVLWSTRQVLKQADPAWLADGLSWQQVYNRMRPFDAGLAPLTTQS